jgi:hypothetical protein
LKQLSIENCDQIYLISVLLSYATDTNKSKARIVDTAYLSNSMNDYSSNNNNDSSAIRLLMGCYSSSYGSNATATATASSGCGSTAEVITTGTATTGVNKIQRELEQEMKMYQQKQQQSSVQQFLVQPRPLPSDFQVSVIGPPLLPAIVAGPAVVGPPVDGVAGEGAS